MSAVDMITLLARRHMTAERCRPATLDGRHDLQLAEAHMAGIGAPPGRSMDAEDVRDLQMVPGHAATGSGGRQLQMFERTLDRLQGGAGNLGIARRGVELLVSQQYLDDPDIDFLLQEMGGEAMPQRVQAHPFVDPGSRPGPIEVL